MGLRTKFSDRMFKNPNSCVMLLGKSLLHHGSSTNQTRGSIYLEKSFLSGETWFSCYFGHSWGKFGGIISKPARLEWRRRIYSHCQITEWQNKLNSLLLWNCSHDFCELCKVTCVHFPCAAVVHIHFSACNKRKAATGLVPSVPITILAAIFPVVQSCNRYVFSMVEKSLQKQNKSPAEPKRTSAF